MFKKIQIGPILSTSGDPVSGSSPVATNVVVNKDGAVRRRPGISTSTSADVTISGDVDSLYVTNDDRLFATANGRIYRVGPTVAVNRTSEGNIITGGKRPVIAETQSLLVYSAGSNPMKLVLDGEIASLLGGEPPVSTHVISNSSRLLCNNSLTNRSRISYSDVTISSEDYSPHESWVGSASSSAGVFTVEGHVDDVVAIASFGNAVHAFGHKNIQRYSPGDAERPYVFSGAVECGTYSPYSLIDYEGSIALLDNRRRFVVYTGTDATYISNDIQQSLDDLTTVSDCYGYRFREGSVDLLIWSFPAERRTFAYQVGGGWSQWNSNLIESSPFYPVTAAVHRYTTAENLVSYSVASGTSKIASASLAAEDDNGEAFSSMVETGYIDHGVGSSKVCAGLHITMKRGTGSTVNEVVMRVSWSDVRGRWNRPVDIFAGVDNDRENVVSLRGLGTYRSRAWRFEIFGDTVVSNIVEEIREVSK